LIMTIRQLWEELLAEADRHVAEGEQHVARQREMVAELERDGHDAKAARELLRQFEQTLAMHVADRDRWRGESRGLDHADTAA
jgi:hemerythrin